MIVPILLYGLEMWGYETCELIESFHFKYCKRLLHLKASTPKDMVYGELDRSNAVLLLWIFYVFVLSCVRYVFVHVCLHVLCGHLLGKG